MFNLVYNSSLLIHNCSPHIHFGSENRQEKDIRANIRCNVVRLCTLMSYDYRCSCRTFIATHVVRHDNLIKQPSDTAVFCCPNIQNLWKLSFRLYILYCSIFVWATFFSVLLSITCVVHFVQSLFFIIFACVLWGCCNKECLHCTLYGDCFKNLV